MNTVDWNKVKFRASSWGNLMTEPKEKAAKDRGELSVTCQKELIKIYNQVKYGRRYEIVTRIMEKGIIGEETSIDLYSVVEKKLYIKNDQELENEWFTGHPDIYTGKSIREAEEVDDIKTRWTLDTFTPRLIEKVDNSEICQLNVYFSLTGAKYGAIVNTLIDCPATILEGEKYALLRRMDVATEENPEFKKAYAQLVKNLTFPDIDPKERVIKQVVQRDDELIQRMKDKVPVLREWLSNFEKTHMSQYPK